jgi:transposase
MERIEMSQEERDWLEWLKRARDKKMTQREAAERMGVSQRWVRKLLRRMKREGDRVVVHGLRGRASNRKISGRVQNRAIGILKQPDWHDFGPTFASEQLAKRHGIELSDETLRGWMIEAGLWKSRTRHKEDVHCWRPRRSAFGELVASSPVEDESGVVPGTTATRRPPDGGPVGHQRARLARGPRSGALFGAANR